MSLAERIPYTGPDIPDDLDMEDRLAHLNLRPGEKALARRIAKAAIGVAFLTDELGQIERIPRNSNGNRESVAQHSLAVGATAIVVADILDADIDLGSALKKAIVHDISEARTGDANTFDLDAEALKKKKEHEIEALEVMAYELPKPLADPYVEYEAGTDPESRLIGLVDKLCPISLNIAGMQMQVIPEDLKVFDLDRLVSVHDSINKRLADKFGLDEISRPILGAHLYQAKYIEGVFQNNIDTILSAESERSPLETERKFCIDLDNLPAHIDLSDPSIERQYIKQAYMEPREDGSEVRIRSINDSVFEQTIKSPGTIQRKEEKSYPEIDAEIFDLWVKRRKEGLMISKTRFIIPMDAGIRLELDVYDGFHNGLVIGEVEFKGRDALLDALAFEPPAWFGKEVTDDLTYKNRYLALHAAPTNELNRDSD